MEGRAKSQYKRYLEAAEARQAVVTPLDNSGSSQDGLLAARQPDASGIHSQGIAMGDELRQALFSCGEMAAMKDKPSSTSNALCNSISGAIINITM